MGLNKFEKKSPPSLCFSSTLLSSLFLFGFIQSNIPSDVDGVLDVGFVIMLLVPILEVDDGGEVTTQHDTTPLGYDDGDDEEEAHANATATATTLARMVLFRIMVCYKSVVWY